MCQVHSYFVFGFLADALRLEIINRLGPTPPMLPLTSVILGVPLAEGMFPEALSASMDSARAAVVFEGYEFDRAARRQCRGQIASALQERGIAVDWVAEAELPELANRTMTLQASIEVIARTLCDRVRIPCNPSLIQHNT